MSRVGADIPPIEACLGASRWKRGWLAPLLRAGGRRPIFFDDSAQAVEHARRRGGAVGVWATREPSELSALAQAAGVAVVRIEDGFIRSVGLGADFMPAASLVFDRRGIYFDPSAPSDLELILAETEFAPELLARARTLVDALIDQGVTKYNQGEPLAALPDDGRRRLFVPGQVEDDLSVLRGGAGVAGNLDLLRRVREANPDAFILYKPHPDVEAGHRLGAAPEREIRRFADEVVRRASTHAIIAAVDEVHVLTSLAGFEALIRGKPVTVHGQPFYAGWGLTADAAPPPRRTRSLTLDQLAAGALLLYPRYFDPLDRAACEPEVLLERLARPELWRPNVLVRARRLQGRLARWLGESAARFEAEGVR